MELEDTLDDHAVEAIDSTDADLVSDVTNFDADTGTQNLPPHIQRKWLRAQWKVTAIILEAYEDILNKQVQQQIKKASKAFVKVGHMHDYSRMCRVTFRFVSEKDAEHAAELFRNLKINDKNIEVFHMEPDEEQLKNLPNEDAPAIVMSNFQKNLTSEEVEKLFPTAHIVTMVKDKDGNLIGAARMEYTTMSLARAAYKENKDLEIDEEKVSLHLIRKVVHAPGVPGVKVAPKRKPDTAAGKDSSGAAVKKRKQTDALMGGRGKGTTSSVGGRGKNNYSVGRGRGIGSSEAWHMGSQSRGMGSGFQFSDQGGHGFSVDQPPDLMDVARYPGDRYGGYERYGRGQDLGDGFRGERMAADIDRMGGDRMGGDRMGGDRMRRDRMGGDFERMGVRGAENELAKLAMDRENVRGLDVNAAAPLILGLAKQLAEKMTAGEGGHKDRAGGNAGGGAYGRGGQGAGMGMNRFSNAENGYTGGYTHQGLERQGLGDGLRGRDGLGQQNDFGRGRSGFGLEGRGFDSNGYGGFDRKGAGRVSETGFGYRGGSEFGGSGSRHGELGGGGSRLSGFGGGGSRLGGGGGGSEFGASGSRPGGFGGGGLGGGDSRLGGFGGGGSRLGGSGGGSRFGDASEFGGGRFERDGFNRGDASESRFAHGDRGFNRGGGFDMESGYERREASGFGRDPGWWL